MLNFFDRRTGNQKKNYMKTPTAICLFCVTITTRKQRMTAIHDIKNTLKRTMCFCGDDIWYTSYNVCGYHVVQANNIAILISSSAYHV